MEGAEFPSVNEDNMQTLLLCYNNYYGVHDHSTGKITIVTPIVEIVTVYPTVTQNIIVIIY